MRTTMRLGADLVALAKRYTGMKSTNALVREGLLLLVAQETARRRAALGLTAPSPEPVPPRRTPGRRK